ncbi:MAG: TetR/AcrR family transcriptional regulator [Nitrospinae bacterium]|nr:TetR/AcrR family transcriptional regulator [Nitrospinota bacterium]
MDKAKKQLNQERENLVLNKALALVTSQGFLALKIADVAKAAGVSIGTFYTHFESKEDLIVALAGETWRGRLQVFEALFKKQDLRPSECMIAAAFCDFLFSLDHPALFVAEQLAVTPQVWKSASFRRTQEIMKIHGAIKSTVCEAARKAIDSGEFKAWDDPDKQAAALDRTVCTLMTGSSYIVHAEFTTQENEEWEAFIPDFLKEHCTAIFSGYGWLSENPRKDVQRIADYCLKHGRFQQLVNSK